MSDNIIPLNNITQYDFRLTLWQKIKLLFVPMQYSIDLEDDYEATIIGFKILDGKIVILTES
jgi:hypothetical protein